MKKDQSGIQRERGEVGKRWKEDYKSCEKMAKESQECISQRGILDSNELVINENRGITL